MKVEDLGGLVLTLKKEGVEVFANVILCGLQVLGASLNIVLKDFLQDYELSYVRKNLVFLDFVLNSVRTWIPVMPVCCISFCDGIQELYTLFHRLFHVLFT